MLPFFNKKKKVASKIGIGGTAESSRRANQKLPSIPPSKDRPISMESDMDLSDRGVVYSRIQDKGMTYASISSRPGQEYQACRGLLRDPMITGGVDDVDAEGTESEESRVYERLKLQRWTDSSQSADGSQTYERLFPNTESEYDAEDAHDNQDPYAHGAHDPVYDLAKKAEPIYSRVVKKREA
eukprot:m.107371 g.107371  ORF g.107371 m.107371 type:complete len:183 (+) comp16917_c0_seq4:115-663(+)